MKRKYVHPEMRCVAIKCHRLLEVSGDPEVKVKRSSGSPNEDTEVGW